MTKVGHSKFVCVFLGLKQLTRHSLLIPDYSGKGTFKIITIINICVEFIVFLNTLPHLRLPIPTKMGNENRNRVSKGQSARKGQIQNLNQGLLTLNSMLFTLHWLIHHCTNFLCQSICTNTHTCAYTCYIYVPNQKGKWESDCLLQKQPQNAKTRSSFLKTVTVCCVPSASLCRATARVGSQRSSQCNLENQAQPTGLVDPGTQVVTVAPGRPWLTQTLQGLCPKASL